MSQDSVSEEIRCQCGETLDHHFNSLFSACTSWRPVLKGPIITRLFDRVLIDPTQPERRVSDAFMLSHRCPCVSCRGVALVVQKMKTDFVSKRLVTRWVLALFVLLVLVGLFLSSLAHAETDPLDRYHEPIDTSSYVPTPLVDDMRPNTEDTKPDSEVDHIQRRNAATPRAFAADATTTEWIGCPVVSNNDPYTPSEGWIPTVEIGLRSDGVVIWRKKETR